MFRRCCGRRLLEQGMVVGRREGARSDYTTGGDGHSVRVEDCASSPPLELRTGHMARFADAAVVASRGDSAVLATVVTRPAASNDVGGFVALSVDFRQSAAAVGKIPTNYLRRELGQSDSDILVSRVIDRSVRPLVPSEVTETIQLQCKPLAVDEEADEVVLAVNAACTALQLSPVPFDGPAAAVRVGIVDGKTVVNPSKTALRHSPLDLLLTGTGDRRTLMIECDAKELPLDRFEEAVDTGLDAVTTVLSGMKELAETSTKEKTKIVIPSSDLEQEMRELSVLQIQFVLTDVLHDKISRDRAIQEILDADMAHLTVKYGANPMLIRRVYSKIVKDEIRSFALRGTRVDGRGVDEFRKIGIEVDVFKKLHGSALFQRGQTQVLATCTFDAPSAAFHPDSISQILGAQRKKSFMLHYEFPGYATNEISIGRGSNRRELGHGALAEKALKAIVPESFPYSVRLACQVLESNGSSSMASVCAGSMALLDAGVPLLNQAAGVAIGIITDKEQPDEKYTVLTDLMGIEDYAGDMDFKIAGTSKGFTAMQLDVKIAGLSRKQLSESLACGQSAVGRLLQRMDESIAKPREIFKDSVPVLETLKLEAFKRQTLFRNGALGAKHIEVETGVKISVDDDTHIALMAPSAERLKRAKELIREMTAENDESSIAFGSMVDCEVVGVMDGGINVTLKAFGKVYFVPKSQLSAVPVQSATALGFKMGERVRMQWLGRDATTGVVRLSRKALMGTSLPGSSLHKKK